MRLDVRAETLCAPSDIERISLPVIKISALFRLDFRGLLAIKNLLY